VTVLSKKAIVARLGLPVAEPKSLVITPLLDDDCFDEDSVDLRLGMHFLLPQIPPQPYFDQSGSRFASQAYLHLHAPLGDYFVLPAHQTVLGATLEFIKMPFDLSGEILTKSSVARSFMLIETAPWIHPFYRGCLTLEIANVSNASILLYPGMPIGQLILMKTAIRKPPDKLTGSYVGPVFPETPSPTPPREHLLKIGIDYYRKPGHGWVHEGAMRKEFHEAMNALSDEQREDIRGLLRLLDRHGCFPDDTPILKLLT
jgi:dCTP deaminase